jgi:hypothetical protein
MIARQAAGELGAGASCMALALGLIALTGQDLPGASPSPPAHTRSPEAPPRELGRSWDGDRALPRHAPRIASYTLEARLDADQHLIEGKGVIRWTNASALPAEEIWLHLYLNAFKNERTLFLRSPFGAGRSGERAEDWGFIDVKRLRARELGGVDLWPGAAAHSPNDPDDQTDIRVPLPEPIGAGETLTLEVEFSSKLPSIVERTGYAGDFHFVAQWFPKLARREPDGTWVHFPFHPQSEFYADYGRYEITIDVPEAMLVGATGARVHESRDAGRLIVRHEADDVHDFAWTAWSGFLRLDETIDGVAVQLLYPRGHDANVAAALEALRIGLPRMNRLYGRYPHPILTVVHPPARARNAGGMEYPMLITTGGPWYAAHSGVRAIEAVTVHELGHQWFQGLVGTDEHAWPFLDEGLTTYVEATTLSAAYGAGSLLSVGRLAISGEAAQRALSAAYGKDAVIAAPAAAFPSFRHLGALVYTRTGTLLGTLGNVYGTEKLQLAIGRYARRYRYAHPTPTHLIAAVQELCGDEAAENMQTALFERGWVDYVATHLGSTPAASPAGIFDRPGGRETLHRDADRPEEWDSRVLILRRGTLRFPVDIELTLADGQRIRKRWDGRGPWTLVTHRGSSPAEFAVVDPDRTITLDDNLLNNAASRGSRGAPRSWERSIYVAALALWGPLP